MGLQDNAHGLQGACPWFVGSMHMGQRFMPMGRLELANGEPLWGRPKVNVYGSSAFERDISGVGHAHHGAARMWSIDDGAARRQTRKQR